MNCFCCSSCCCFLREIPNCLNLGKRQDFNFHLWELEHKTIRLTLQGLWNLIAHFSSYFLTLLYSFLIPPPLQTNAIFFFWARGILYLLCRGVSLVKFPGYSEGHEQSHYRKDTILIHVPIRLSALRLCFLSSCCLLLLPFLYLFPDTLKHESRLLFRCWVGGKGEGDWGKRAQRILPYFLY